MPDEELSLDELEFMAAALDGPLLAFAPLEDPMIVDLIDRQLVILLPDADPEHSLLELTDVGKKSVARQLR
jgi:hypothetical protein